MYIQLTSEFRNSSVFEQVTLVQFFDRINHLRIKKSSKAQIDFWLLDFIHFRINLELLNCLCYLINLEQLNCWRLVLAQTDLILVFHLLPSMTSLTVFQKKVISLVIHLDLRNRIEVLQLSQEPLKSVQMQSLIFIHFLKLCRVKS